MYIENDFVAVGTMECSLWVSRSELTGDGDTKFGTTTAAIIVGETLQLRLVVLVVGLD